MSFTVHSIAIELISGPQSF